MYCVSDEICVKILKFERLKILRVDKTGILRPGDIYCSNYTQWSVTVWLYCLLGEGVPLKFEGIFA